MNNSIPPMTHPLRKGWRQPDMTEVLVDDTHAVMDRKTFDGLAEYSYTYPTGVYEGKCWKSKSLRDGFWWLNWFGFSEDPDKCSNHSRLILVVE